MKTAYLTGVVVLPVLYTLLVMSYAKTFARQPSGLALHVRTLLVATVAVHFFTLLLRGIEVGACPLGQAAEFLALVSLCIAAIYLLLEIRSGERTTGVFVLIVAFGLQLLATVSMLVAGAPGDYPVGGVASAHSFAAVIGYSAVAVAGIYALLYLLLYRAIKRGQFGLFYQKMVPLDMLSRLNVIAATVGFLALTVTGGLGFWMSRAPGAGSGITIESILTIVLWVLYGVSLAARQFFRLGGKRLAYATIVGLLFVVAVIVTGLVQREFHA